jgi:hypothetical protein
VAQIFQAVATRVHRAYGWTSTWYPIADTYEQAWTLADQMNTKEMLLHPSDVMCNHIRLSEVHTPGDVWPGLITTVASDAPATGPSGTYEPNYSLPVKLAAGLDHRATVHLRGLDSAWFVPGNPAAWHVPTAAQAGLAAYFNFFLNNFGIYSRPGKRNDFQDLLIPINTANGIVAGLGYYQAKIRRAGRPFDLPRGRRMTA